MKFAMLQLILVMGATFTLSPIARADSTPDSDTAHKQLDQILQRPMFQQWRLRQNGELPQVDIDTSPLVKRWFQRISDSVSEFFKWLFRSRSQPSRSRNWSALATSLKAIAWIALAAILVFLTLVVVKILSRGKSTASIALILSRSQVRDALEAGDALALGSDQWLAEARRLAAEQNFRAVYRALYLALLSGLHTAGKIQHSRNRTNWVYVQHYRGPATERATFGELTDLFDHVWYGRQDAAGINDLDQLRQKVATLTHSGAPS